MKTFHILPLNDTKEHTESSQCPCNPEILQENHTRLIVHNAFDGREVVEQLLNHNIIVNQLN